MDYKDATFKHEIVVIMVLLMTHTLARKIVESHKRDSGVSV